MLVQEVIEKNTKILTLDLGWGDSGKGKVVDWLCQRHPTATVVRYSGASNCGHTVYKKIGNKDVSHIFSIIGSGALSGCPTYIDKGVYWNPIKLINEYIGFIEDTHRFDIPKPEIYVHPESIIISIFEIDANRKDHKEKNDGTCGQGVYRTIKREKDGFHLRAIDLFYEDIFFEKLNSIAYNYYHLDEDLWVYKGICDDISQICTLSRLNSERNNGIEIYESNQGLLLDEYIGTMPHCTPTPILPKYDFQFDECYLITRSYHTRHGHGPFNEIAGEPYNNPYEINVYNQWQGDFRTSYLNMNRLKYVINNIPQNIAKKFHLVINHLDIESKRYVLNNKIVECANMETFINDIIGNIKDSDINLDNVYISDSPYSDSLKLYPFTT